MYHACMTKFYDIRSLQSEDLPLVAKCELEVRFLMRKILKSSSIHQHFIIQYFCNYITFSLSLFYMCMDNPTSLILPHTMFTLEGVHLWVCS